MSIRLFYDHWSQYNRRLTEVVATMTAEQLAVRPGPDRWPVWATVAHTAGMRAYWLCVQAGEPGAETTPWLEPGIDGWEDHLDHPRDASELVRALDTTWAIIERVLDTWTPESLGTTIEREYAGHRQVHSRSSILQRMLTHDAYHCGELSQTLGVAGLPQIDLWS